MAQVEDRWEKRARELLPDCEEDERWMPGETARLALQLGREMADARAEEIAKRLDGYGAVPIQGSIAAIIARSTIAKQNPTDAMHESLCALREAAKPEPVTASEVEAARRASDEAAIRADEREKIINRLDGYRDAALKAKQNVLVQGVLAARSVVLNSALISPKTREAVLEEALREISHFGPELRGADVCAQIARRALEWK